MTDVYFLLVLHSWNPEVHPMLGWEGSVCNCFPTPVLCVLHTSGVFAATLANALQQWGYRLGPNIHRNLIQFIRGGLISLGMLLVKSGQQQTVTGKNISLRTMLSSENKTSTFCKNTYTQKFKQALPPSAPPPPISICSGSVVPISSFSFVQNPSIYLFNPRCDTKHLSDVSQVWFTDASHAANLFVRESHLFHKQQRFCI